MNKWTCRKVRLNAGGYEYGKWGKYYGHGAPLWKLTNSETGNDYMLRSATRNQAILDFCGYMPLTPKPEDFYGFKR